MTMVICKECSGAISERADTCVHCGSPLMEYTSDLVGIAFALLYVLYTIATICIMGLAILGTFVVWAEQRILPSSSDLIVFFLWVISIAVGGILAGSLRRGVKSRIKGTVRVAGDAEIERFIARRDGAAS